MRLLLFAFAGLVLSCPSSQVIDGRPCDVTCNQDRPGGDYKAVQLGCFQDCIDACAKDSQCLTAQYANGFCYLKNQINAAVDSSTVDSVVCGAAAIKSCSAKTVTKTQTVTAPGTTITSIRSQNATVTAPGMTVTSTQTTTATPMASGTTIPDFGNCTTGNTYTNGSTYVFLCNYTCTGDNIDTAPNEARIATVEQCADLCEATAGCVAGIFSYAYQTPEHGRGGFLYSQGCQLKSGVLAAMPKAMSDVVYKLASS